MFMERLVQSVGRAVHAERLRERLGHLGTRLKRPATEVPEAVDLRAIIHSMVVDAGEDGVLTCYVNDLKLNVPSGMLAMFRDCLHATAARPLTYYVETRHLQWMCGRLVAGDVAADIGASGGILTASLSRVVGPSGQVFAFEPANRAFRLLKRMVCFNELGNVVIEKMAVSSQVGTAEFSEFRFAADDVCLWRPEASSIVSATLDTDMGTAYQVPVTTVDEYFAAKPVRLKLVKIDVEGFETEVLKGAAEILRRDRPSLAIDIHYRVDGTPGTTEGEVCELLAPYGYRFDKLNHVLVAYA